MTAAGWPNYDVSDTGTVRNKNGYILRQHDRHGYKRVTLYKNGRKKSVTVHRLVLQTFVGPAPEGKPLGLHGPGGNADNRVGNLYWGCAKQNARDRNRDGTQAIANRTVACSHC